MAKKLIYPKNKEYFKRLLPYARKIINLLKKNKIPVAIYGSYSHFVYTKDSQMNVNDIDLLVPKKNFSKIMKLLGENKIEYKHPKESETIITREGDLKVEIDAIGKGYHHFSEKAFSKRNGFTKNDFYGMPMKILRLEDLEEMYIIAHGRSRDDKPKIMKKIKHLERFLGRRLKGR